VDVSWEKVSERERGGGVLQLRARKKDLSNSLSRGGGRERELRRRIILAKGEPIAS